MDLGSAARLLLRRWWVLLIGLILTLGGTAYLYTQAAPNYQATARMILLLPPNARETVGPGSPYLYLPNGLQVLAGIVIEGPSGRKFHQTMAAAGLTSQYELGVEVGSPIVSLSVEGSDPQNVIATRDRVIKGVQEELASIQRTEKTPARQTAHARVYAIEPTPDVIEGNRTRSLLMALGLGGLATLLATFLIDRALQMRRERRSRVKPSDEPQGPDEDGRSDNDQRADQQLDVKETAEPQPSSLAHA